MHQIIHLILHLLTGIFFFLMILQVTKKKPTLVQLGVMISLGSLGGILPDISKFFGDLYLHSVLLLPLLAMIFTFFSYYLLKKDFSLLRLYIASLIAIGSHLLVDYLGNGVALLYPFSTKEFSLYILLSVDWIWIIIVTIGILTIFYKYSYLVLGILVMYTGLLLFSNIQLRMYLENEYRSENIEYLEVFAMGSRTHWDFIIKTESSNLFGQSPIWKKDVTIE